MAASLSDTQIEEIWNKRSAGVSCFQIAKGLNIPLAVVSFTLQDASQRTPDVYDAETDALISHYRDQ